MEVPPSIYYGFFFFLSDREGRLELGGSRDDHDRIAHSRIGCSDRDRP